MTKKEIKNLIVATQEKWASMILEDRASIQRKENLDDFSELLTRCICIQSL